jgi:hypothetical protein
LLTLLELGQQGGVFLAIDGVFADNNEAAQQDNCGYETNEDTQG